MERPDPNVLRQILRYDPDTGQMFWLPRPESMFTSRRAFSTFNAQFAGTEALALKNKDGYRRGSCLGVDLRAHRAAWAIVTGRWPDGEIDHINGDPSDNRWENLRCATISENRRNTRLRKDSESGVKGVSMDRRRGKWRARIHADATERHLGYFDNLDDARAAYAKASAVFHGEFGRLE